MPCTVRVARLIQCNTQAVEGFNVWGSLSSGVMSSCTTRPAGHNLRRLATSTAWPPSGGAVEVQQDAMDRAWVPTQTWLQRKHRAPRPCVTWQDAVCTWH